MWALGWGCGWYLCSPRLWALIFSSDLHLPQFQVWANIPDFLLIVCLLGGQSFIESAPCLTTVHSLYMS